MRRRLRQLKNIAGMVLLGATLSLPACISHPTAPVTDLSPVDKRRVDYTVQADDTLHAISFRTGIDYQKLAAWNAILPPYKIYVGDVLALRKPAVKQTVKQTVKTSPPPRSKPRQKKLASAPIPIAKLPTSVKGWQWPAKGKLTQTYSKAKARYGIQISANRKTPIFASAPGQVVYVGDGIKGYGKLLIVKHSTKFISAYAHNDLILVNEGDRVKAGQEVARMGSTGTRGVKLHFEIRKSGEPMNPLKYLPLKRG